MRNPNGYGNISKLPGKRRKPFRVRVTTGWELNEEKGKLIQLYKPIGYYKTRPEAMLALAEYHKNPNSLESSTVTFAELFKKWSDKKYAKATKSTINGYNAAYNYSAELYDMKFIEIKKPHMQSVIDQCERGHGTLKKIKVLFNQLFKYALENDIVIKDYSKFIEIGKNESESTRKPFTNEEIKELFNNVDRMDYIDTILIMIYTGLRIGELLLIENINVDIENRTIKGGLKTDAGKNRIIPINKKILPFVSKRHAEGHKYLVVNYENNKMKYWNYKDEKWSKIMEQIGMDHLPHDCRHTFATLMDNAGANKVSIKRIMGHSSTDITDKVYTHKDIEELKKAIDLI
ncbi:MAG: integrase [Desulfosporosinus sp. BRH_c37]|nr:MAG: integrase [Desulfosporosinus sp. BRH_c37]